jgi:putative Mg2+ transporter-C (MgtC) family protein
MTLIDFALRIGASVLFGFLIGVERQLTGHPAGIRTNVLVSFGSSMFVIFSFIIDGPDQTRIAAQIVTGVGFLCSGIIFKDGVTVRGLNTAATIWCSAAIGVLSSSGFISYALLATGLLIGVNVILRPISNKINPILQFEENSKCYQVTVICAEEKELLIRSMIINYISSSKLILTDLENMDVGNGKAQIIAKITSYGKRKDEIVERLIRKISVEPHVTSAGWEVI